VKQPESGCVTRKTQGGTNNGRGEATTAGHYCAPLLRAIKAGH
jgi:hypothetical protein